MKVTYVDHCGTDLSVVNSARVSFNKKSDWDYGIEHAGVMKGWSKKYPKLHDRDRKLIHYLAREGHTSPFNHTFITLHVKAPIFVARQLVKHKFMPWNEVSRRYVDDEPEFYYPEEWRGKSKDKKQGSDGVVGVPKLFETPESTCLSAYKDLLEMGVCPEQARMVLPLNTYTEWYWSGTLGAWADMYNLRSKPDTQLETQEIANQAGSIIKPLFPVAWEALTGGKDE